MQQRRRNILMIAGSVAVLVSLTVLVTRYDLHTVGTAVMSPAIAGGEVVAVEKGTSAAPGNVVVIDGWDGFTYTVRVAGRGGDVLVCCDSGGHLTRNGTRVNEPYALGDTKAFGSFRVTVPAGRVFVLGDARSVSVDSRTHLADQSGTLPQTGIHGRVVAVASPVWKVRPVSGVAQFALFATLVGGLVLGVAAWLVAWWSTLRRWTRAVTAALSRLRRSTRAKLSHSA